MDIIKKIPNSSKLVIKDNALIMASYRLTVEEQRLILACIAKANDNKKKLSNAAITVQLSVSDYAALYNVKMKTAYEALPLASDKLWERTIRISDGKKDRKIRWLQEQATYDSGKVHLTFSTAISDLLRNIVSDQATRYRLEQATQLRNQHSIRLFEIFQMLIDSDKKEASWDISISELKEILGIEDRYPRWADFKKRVIEEPVKQLNNNTSLKVDWDVSGKIGKRIDSIIFHVFEGDQLQLKL